MAAVLENHDEPQINKEKNEDCEEEEEVLENNAPEKASKKKKKKKKKKKEGAAEENGGDASEIKQITEDLEKQNLANEPAEGEQKGDAPTEAAKKKKKKKNKLILLTFKIKRSSLVRAGVSEKKERIEAHKIWAWTKLLRVPWIGIKNNNFHLINEINPGRSPDKD
ncbi:hypothetical protein LAZ67_20000182 [Cordylochernes scorpioides]|uniref:Uncharacterized protein n=1 Tax=Cordylochernes scorpioides TaxID=51811 RepID=A0ABY6LLU1_9ARAC|nr:hypothetical protein LAZ67_20000182 [Cordylochernes scorpioides]